MLSDCHIHMVLDGVYWKDAIARHRAGVREDWVRRTLSAYRQRGITYLRDGGDRWGVCSLAAQLAPEYGIRYRIPGAPIHKNGHYGGFIGRGFDTMADFRALVEETKRSGADFIKIMISGLMDFDRLGVLTDVPLTPEEIREMIAIAHGEGFSVMAHANGDATVAAAIAAGVDSIEHGAYLGQETLHRLAESRTVWVPTLVTFGNLIGCGRYPDEVLHRLLAGQQEAIVFAAAQGAAIGCGSDAGAYRVFHGKGTQDEHALLAEALGERAPQLLAYAQGQIERKFRFYG